ncbi:RNA polymerase sigma factor [Sphaerisporangium fuscum]|uniref:RNA polymerase sigma factor n=1 Tax=Sphaerisporangium fuscum TaxID=2835868 RepID=UPI0027E33D3C|nr:RNA polymerase sigma factor [Sphaerisporangium fuscum]
MAGLGLHMTGSAPPRIREHAPGSDSAVIEASLREPERFAELFDRHAAVLHRYVVRRLGPDHAEDVVAEAFTRAFEKRHKYAFDRPDALPWLYGIATNIIGTHRRKEVRGYHALARTGEDPVAVAFDEQVVARVTASATRERLAAALAKLGRGERDVLLLIAWGDLSYEETATALDVPIGTVRSRLSRARRKIAKALGGTNPTDLIEETP